VNNNFIKYSIILSKKGFLKMRLNLLARLAAATLMLCASATHAEEKSEISIGMVYVGGDSIYVNVKSSSAVMPSISYKSDKLNISVQDGLAYQVTRGEKASVGVSIRPNFRPYKSTDSTDLAGMTRDMYFDGSLNVSYKIARLLTAKLDVAAELSNKFNGNSVGLSLGQKARIGGQPFIFQVGAKWYDTNRANYLFGVKASEATGQRAQYAPGSAILPYISVQTFHSFTKQTSLFANVNLNFLPTNVVDSPIVKRGRSMSTILGLNYSF
jgi:outer membrane scaffolding protein for murein synthesis (MipA/OmpV family)